MKIVNHEKFTELIPENKYITNIEETDVMEGICGKNLNPADYKDISDEEAEKLLNRLSKMADDIVEETMQEISEEITLER